MPLTDILAAAGLGLSVMAAGPHAMPAGHFHALAHGGVAKADGHLGPAAGPNFQAAGGAWDYARRSDGAGWRWRGRRHRGGDLAAYSYGDYPYLDDGYDAAYAYGDGGGGPSGLAPPYYAGGPGPFGPPPPPYGGFRRRLPPVTAVAPLAYGPGVHDGAYAYGYSGHAQTPAL